MPEFLSMVLNQTGSAAPEVVSQMAGVWRSANDHVKELERDEAGLCDGPPIGELSAKLKALEREVLVDPIFRRAFSVLPTRIGMVDLDRLVVFQKDINLEAVRDQKRALPSPLSEEDLFRLCLPADHPHPDVHAIRLPAQVPAFSFVSPSTDFRVLDVTVLEGNPIQGAHFGGPVTHVLVAAVGYGPNFLQAVHCENRLVLSNGSHRAYLLRELGFKQVPCLVQEASRREELDAIGGALAQNPDLYLKASRPPLLKDYFDEKLRVIVRLPKKARQVRLMVQPEQSDVPSN
ncbi:MAG: hypothetical protein KGJ23_11270 [Euryarchaeota archaeon]|nr:hypothetical protein [Euryarchaeota archaeon]MDE1837174.1 hypothetical protein [Euryarchaeota archaeon]MDE1881098.1 hypothetical protein [Euryarchaeota archaeon]MDE2045330.1 hypothetical protein [Thermoplasmata archaeon]